MILILSQAAMEPTTEEVMDWLGALGARCLRLNGEDLDGGRVRFSLTGSDATLEFDGFELPAAEVGAVWFRRWIHEGRHELAERIAPGSKLDYDLRRHLTQEQRRLSGFVFSRFADRPWLSRPRRSGLDKLDVLARAARAGFATPATLVTTERDALLRFRREHGSVITKPIGEVDLFLDGELSHFLYTASLDAAAAEALPERFAPSLFQERIDKIYEMRVFYLAGDCSGMAIFSQGDAQTRTDFRHYNRERPNRMVPLRLSPETAARIQALMEDLDLETGSLDLLRTPDGREVFLEVNPVGQFGMVSKPCNYRLEKRVAEHLMGKERDGGQRRVS
ncbi:MAG: grasp-with-spasm system ATP-grasp peptide maturase [Thermoanaerobaculia bacterium]